MAVAAHPHPVEHTTALALEEKKKLQKAFAALRHALLHVCAFVGLDTLGLVASNGAQGFTWLVLLAVLFVSRTRSSSPRSEARSPRKAAPTSGSKLAFGRFPPGSWRYYWVTNPLWVGGSLAFIASDAWEKPRYRADSTPRLFGRLRLQAPLHLVLDQRRDHSLRRAMDPDGGRLRPDLRDGLLHPHGRSSTR